jgi:predicted ribonuclease YlaK
MYKGYLEVAPTEAEWANLYEQSNDNVYDCLENQYLLIKNSDDEVVDRFKCVNGAYKKLSYKQVNNSFVSKIKPRNVQQECAFDMLQDKNTTIKVLTGRFGSGKTFLMVVNALQLLYENKFERIVWVRNNIGVKDTKDIGALPGTEWDKLLPYVMPLADAVGGVEGVEMLMHQGKLEVQHLGFIRGRDIKNSIIICSEAENLTKQHVQLLIGRVGEGSNLWLDGDFKQVDSKVFENNNGLNIAIDKLKGHPLFGYVHLEKSERSATAAMADLLD